MTDDRTPIDPGAPDPDLSAAELALGLLEGDERAMALRRVLAEPAFARDVEMWRAHFAQMFADWPEVVPPESVFPAIERTLDRPASAPAKRASGFWPVMATAATLVAACLALVMILRPAAAPIVITRPVSARTPVLVAQLAAPKPEAGAQPVAALYDPATGSIRIASATFADVDKAAELWVIPGDGVPRAMGLLRHAQPTPLPVGPDNRPLLAPGATLAVSIEPLGGSPTGKPTGPVVATGMLSLV